MLLRLCFVSPSLQYCDKKHQTVIMLQTKVTLDSDSWSPCFDDHTLGCAIEQRMTDALNRTVPIALDAATGNVSRKDATPIAVPVLDQNTTNTRDACEMHHCRLI